MTPAPCTDKSSALCERHETCHLFECWIGLNQTVNDYLNNILRSQSRSSIYEMQEAPTAALDNQKRMNRRMVRLITAMIFAAKSDGVIDDKEHMAIRRNVEQLQLGTDAEDVIQHALIQPLDPSIVAKDGFCDGQYQKPCGPRQRVCDRYIRGVTSPKRLPLARKSYCLPLTDPSRR